MGYRDIYKESNEQAEERFSLVMERIAEIAEETDVPEKFDDYFKKTAAFLLQLKNVSEKAEKDTLKDASLTECEKQNAGFYDDIKAENYGNSLKDSSSRRLITASTTATSATSMEDTPALPRYMLPFPP